MRSLVQKEMYTGANKGKTRFICPGAGGKYRLLRESNKRTGKQNRKSTWI